MSKQSNATKMNDARKKAIGVITGGRVDALEAAGLIYAHRNSESGIACATLSLMREIDDARRVIASKLHDVAADDLIEPHELPDLKEVLIKLIKAEKAINAVKLIAAKHIDIDQLMPEKRKTPAAIAVAETRACYKS